MQVMNFAFAMAQLMWRELNEALEMAVHRQAMEMAEDRGERHDRLQQAADHFDSIGMRRVAAWCRAKLRDGR